MAAMNDTELYPIGDVARRTGLSVSAVRYYGDTGIVPATRVTAAGHRLYDVAAIARLELVRTLRELDTGLDGIRQLLDGETDLHGLLAAHLEIVERQGRALRARRAVLRTLLKQHGTAAQAALLHRLASLSDEERERIVDAFWTEVVTDLDLTPDSPTGCGRPAPYCRRTPPPASSKRGWSWRTWYRTRSSAARCAPNSATPTARPRAGS